MFLARVQGHVVATAKDPGIAGRKLLVVEPLKLTYDTKAGGGTLHDTGRAIVALDTLGAGEGQIVLIVQGSSARMAEANSKTPTDAAVVGIVDEAVVLGEAVK